MERGSDEARLRDYQKNAAFVLFVFLICFSDFVSLTRSLADVLAPLVWSGFFAVPLTGLIDWINRKTTYYANLLCGDHTLGDAETIDFACNANENQIVLEQSEVGKTLMNTLERPSSGKCGGFIFRCCDGCCAYRLRITRLSGEHAAQSEVNRLVMNWAYFPKAVEQRTSPERTSAEDGLGADRIELFLDQEKQYPAVVRGAKGEGVKITGTLQLETISNASWYFAVLISISVMLVGVCVFVLCMYLGVSSLQRNTKAYQSGSKDVVEAIIKYLEKVAPKGYFDDVNTKLQSYAEKALPDLITGMTAHFQSLGFHLVMFIIYLLFWICEPLPLNSNVAQLIKTYLFMKTIVCLLYAGLMSLLLYCLNCPFWHIFFVITFLMNYIPEVGPLLAGALMVPAILFDGRLSMDTRRTNVALLVLFGLLFKVITANFIELRMYSKSGGQYMRMHPVVLMALMMLFESLLGITGMFLAIPIMAAVKYYMVSADMPPIYLDPMLLVIEGDEAGPHKNFVDRHRVTYGTLEQQKMATSSAPAATLLDRPVG